ncbi:TIR domain-containing protein [Pseudoflavitalea sp. X16]|uniref:TIR domain-containing protein n=1 Tax=Paraflavitalea devenefica TaxID=2716334 RepID=UPI001422FA3E|nr:TIR domain-containing protein [Paraflavitalea devenefica]NII29399.1 TIR domain-containing protein [Paraflavitalea devenefica]
MTKRQVFYSFHFDNDVMRVQQIRNIGVIEGNEPVSKNDWEEVKKKGDTSIKKWIDDNMKYKQCVVVLIGSDTANRPWVDYEIRKGWNDGKAALGIYIHNIKCAIEVRSGKSGTCAKGANPFQQISMSNGGKLSDYVQCYNPDVNDAYNDIAQNLNSWIEAAINARQ